jgi:hypothetical protein
MQVWLALEAAFLCLSGTPIVQDAPVANKRAELLWAGL